MAPWAAHAQSTWNGGGGSSLWSADGNWSAPLGGNGFNAGLVFAGSTNLSTNNDLTTGTATSITFDASAGGFTLGGNALTLSGSIVNSTPGLQQTIGLPLILTSNTHVITMASTGTTVISGNISGGSPDGTNAITYSGVGSSLVLTGSNSYTGNTNVTSGYVVVGHANALGTGSLIFANASNTGMDVLGSQSITIPNSVRLTNANGTFIGSGGGSLFSSGTLVLAGSRTMNVNSGTFGIAVLTSTSGTMLTKAGVGTMVITGSADASFAPVSGTSVNLNGGVLALGHNNALGTGTFALSSNSNVVRAYSTDLTGIPNPVILATNTTTFDGQNSLTFSGGMTQNSSRDIVNNISGGKTLTFSGTTSLQTSTMSGGRQLTVRGTGTTVFSGPVVDGGITGSGTLSVPGIVVLSASNGLTGGISVSSGGLVLINHPKALGSGSLSFGGNGSFDNASGAPISVTNNIRMGGGSGTFIGSSNGSFSTSGTLFYLGSNRTLTVSSGTVTIGGISTNSGSTYRLTKSGSGTLVINNAADASVINGFRLDGGLLLIGSTNALGTGTFEIANSTSVFRPLASDMTIANPIYLTTATSTFDGAYGVTLTGGLTQDSDRKLVNNISPGKALTFVGTTALQTVAATVGRTLSVAGTGSTVFAGQIIDGGTFASGLSAAGNVTLSASNGFTGGVSVSGYLAINHRNALGTGPLSFSSGTGTFDNVTGTPVSVANDIRMFGASGTFAGAGGSTFTTTGSLSYGGGNKTMTVASGTLGIGSLSGTSPDVRFTKAGAGTLVIAGAASPTTTGTVRLSGGLTLAGDAAALGSGTLEMLNAATFRPQAADMSFANPLSLSGTAVLDGPYSVTFTNGASQVGSQDLVNNIGSGKSLTINGVTALQDANGGTGQTLTVRGSGNTIFGGAIVDGGTAGSGNLTVAGPATVTLSAASTFTGNTTVAAGTLVLAAAGSIAASPVVKVEAGATFDVTAQAGGYVVPTGQTLAGNGTVAGAVSVSTGATLAPGASPGMLTISGAASLVSGGNYNWQMLNATGTAGAGWDLLSVGGVLDVAATSSAPFSINLWSLSATGPDTNGDALNFSSTTSGTWRIATAAGGITGFAADKFAINVSATNGTAGFSNSLSGGTFSLAQSGNDLNLVFTKAAPQPVVVTINVASGTQTQSQAGYPLLSGTVPVEKTGAGTAVLNQSNTLTGPTTVSQGTLDLAVADALGSSAVTVAAGATLSVGPQVQAVVPSLTNNGQVDLGLGRLTITAGQTAEGIVAQINDGIVMGGTTGITSTEAAATGGAFTVGWVDNFDGSFTASYAAAGDTNLDNVVDLTDLLNTVGSGFYDTGNPANWAAGDFNYDGVSDLTDLLSLVGGGLYDQGDYNPASLNLLPSLSDGGIGGVAAVPEPSTFGLATVAAGMLCWLRRRR